MSYALELDGIVKSYGNFTVVNNIDLKVPDGAFVSLLGASGCGKSTTLRIIAGLESLDSGKIRFHGQDITHLPPAHRDMRMMFQDYALFPNMTLAENIEFPLTIRKNRKKFAGKVEETTKRYLELVHMQDYADRKPHQISGGQRQRIALARALVSDPSIVLFDEPLGALDASLRHAMQYELKCIHTEYGKTFISVTHDQEEAMAMSDLIVLMKDGEIQQIDRPDVIYTRPKNRYVAEFFGSGSAVLDVVVKAINGNTARLELPGGAELTSDNLPDGLQVHGTVGLHVRPERIELSGERPSRDDNVITAAIEDFIFLGGRTEYKVRLGSAPETIITVSRSGPPLENEFHGADVFLSFDPKSISVLDR